VTGILLDTHVLLWTRLAQRRLNRQERIAIRASSPRYVSIVSLWEIGILLSLRRVAADPRLFQIPQGFELLHVFPEHCESLPLLPQHHRDPFDRMLIAQACAEQLTLITRDREFSAYGSAGLSLLAGSSRRP
jgi:PIN domain nuclease of toxin-antitoxin system